MAPGRNELVEGIPFVGGSGRVLGAALSSSGSSIQNVRIVNAVNCFPAGPDEKLTDEQKEACWPRLMEEIAACSPSAILCLGADALEAVTGLSGPGNGISVWQQYLIRPEPGVFPSKTKWIVPGYHPSFIMRSAMKPYPWLRSAVSRAVRAASENGSLSVVYPPKKNSEWPDEPPHILGVDIETDGFSNVIERVGLAWPGGSLSVPWSWGAAQKTAELLADPRSVKIAHNWNFDAVRFLRNGIEVKGKLWDTLWGAQRIDPDAPGYSLNEVAPFYVDCERWKHERKSDEEDYNRKDAFYMPPIYAIQRRELIKTGQLAGFERQMEALPILIELQTRGLRVDLDEQARLYKHYEQRAKWSEARWIRDVGPIEWRTTAKNGKPLKHPKQSGGTNPKSPAQLAKLLYTEWGLPVQYKREKGEEPRVTTDAEAIANLIELDESEPRRKALKALLHCRHFPKFIETYLSCDEEIYPAYAPGTKDDAPGGRFKVSAATGRIVARGSEGTPPIQQMPGPLRRMILPSEPGLVFVKADYDSQELRIIAAIAKEETLLAEIAAGVDIHAINAVRLGCDRTRAKNAFYSWCFGGRGKGMIAAFKQYGFFLTLAEAEAFKRFYDQRYPRIPAWHQEVYAEAREKKYVVTLDGWRRYFPDPSIAFNEIVNVKIQRGGSFMAWENIIPLHSLARSFGGNLSILVHDEFVCEIPRESVEKFIPAFRETLERKFDLVTPGFSCPVTIGSGDSWGGCRKVLT